MKDRQMLQGTIKRFNGDYGFIQPDDFSADCFFHARDFERAKLAPPKIGDRIQFDPVSTAKGWKISNPRFASGD